MTGAIVDLSARRDVTAIDADVCVIGSGAAGATAARLLAEAGRDVVVLEEGGDYVGSALTQRDGEMYDRLYMERGGRTTEDLGITVLQGRVLGGGTVINASDVVPIPDGVLAHWRRKHGLTTLTDRALAPHRDATLVDLSASRIEDERLNAANRLLRAGAEALGLRGEVMMHNRVGCAGLGTCLIGCPVGSKRNARTVAIPAGLEAGATYYVRARAKRIDGAERERKTIRMRALDAEGRREQREVTVRARTVIVAASAIESAHLLLRSGIGNEHVGRHLMLQPQLPLVAEFPERVEAFRGIPQAYAVTEHEREDDPEHGLWGFRIEAIMGTPGIVSTMLPGTGADAMRLMKRYAHLAASLLLVPDAPSGRVTAGDAGRPRIEYRQREDHASRLRQAIEVAARVYLEAGAVRVIVPATTPIVIESARDLSRMRDARFTAARAPLISAHQQGTVRFAPNARDGAADPEGRVHGARGVYVMDSSLFPSSASSHIMAPIMTIARHLASACAT